jgi:hypothetical protein
LSCPESSSSVPLESVQRLDPAPTERTAAEVVQQDATADGPRDVPRPIGPGRLRALRQAIESGSFPTEEDISSGLERMFMLPPEEPGEPKA